jgi:hypothetical protein
LQFLHRNQLKLTVAGGNGESFEVELCVPGHDRHAHSVAIATGDERLENLLRRKSKFGGDGLGGEVVGINLVFPKLIWDVQPVEQPHGVGLVWHEDIVRSGPRASACDLRRRSAEFIVIGQFGGVSCGC